MAAAPAQTLTFEPERLTDAVARIFRALGVAADEGSAR